MNAQRVGAPDGSATDHRATAAWIAAGLALLIAWGSLYPLDFRWPDAAALHRRIGAVAEHLYSRTDVIANVLLYLPLGAALRLCGGGAGSSRRFAIAVLTSSLLSAVLEIAQLFTPHRVTSVFDWALNTVGAACGAAAVAAYLSIGRRRPHASLRHPRPALVPFSLLSIWLIGEFTPYLPSHRQIPIGRLWWALLHGHAPPLSHWCLALTRWWIIAECIRQIWRPRWALPLLASLIALTALEQAYIGTDHRGIEELLTWAAMPLLVLATRRSTVRARAWCTILGCLAVLATANLAAITLPPRAGVFHWVPFSGTLLASRDYRPLLDALFLLGALFWSLATVLGRVGAAFALTLAASVAVEIVHLWTPPHRAEVTDPLLVIALLIAFAAARRHQRYAFGSDAREHDG